MKIRRISDFQCSLPFPKFEENYQSHFEAFLRSDLGKIYQAVPWQDLVREFGLRDHRKGPCATFSPRGKVALMFLKHYACCSDSKLVEQLNANVDYQLFCDIHIPPSARLTNAKIVSEIRCELARRLDIPSVQQILMEHWRPYLKNLDSVVCDATCYETAIRYPTDVKLLWEAVCWSYVQLRSMSKQAGVRLLRTKYKKWEKRYAAFSKLRRKPSSRKRRVTRGLLRLLEKINGQLQRLERLKDDYRMSPKYAQRRQTIEKIFEQQYAKFHYGITPKDRIVSIDKYYIRPIVRGKETKRVEFGAKAHKLQIDGISFIEHLSFDSFHEGIRLEKTLFTAQVLSRKKVKLLGADAIYATNTNRTMLTTQGIRTDFKRKGRAGKHENERKQLAKMIRKERISRLEGSFGTDKEHFLLKRIGARTKQTEILWIFFGIHTSNALNIGKRMAPKVRLAA